MRTKTRRWIGTALLLGGLSLLYWVFGLVVLQCVDWVRHGRWLDLPLSTLFLQAGVRDSLALGLVPELPAALLATLRGALGGPGWLLGQPLGAVVSALGIVLIGLGGWIHE